MKQDPLSDLLGLLSDRKSRELLNIMVQPGFNTITLRKKSKMTKKQLYSRTCKMLKMGFIARSKGKLSVTVFGKAILHNLQDIQKILEDKWKFKAINAIDSQGMSVEEHKKLVHSILNDAKMERIIWNVK
ncbi:MAG: hypothetical protein M3530_05220 [Thermoproteota archaeon]|nr:hypothetical protein [Thermoproteota archaeon]